MAINLSNVNISLNEFQRLSKGDFNAGEVRLSDEHKLKKMNNHVNTRWFSNNNTISHAEVLTIKQALVNALSTNGVSREGLDNIRKELGLAAKGSVDTGLVARSIKPLTRQQIREILDKHAETINAFNAANHGDVHIKTTRELYGAGKMSDNSLKEQKRINDALSAQTRAIPKNESLLCLSRIIANDIEFDTDVDTKTAILAKAKEQLKKLKTLDAAGHDENAKVSFDCAMDHGPCVTISTGMTKAAMIQRLEDVIARLGYYSANPKDAELDARREFKAIAEGTADETKTARDNYLAGLGGKANGDVMARAIGVMLMSEAGITDWNTLSAVNRLSKDDAIAFARRLVSLGPDATDAAIRNDADLQSIAARANLTLPSASAVCIPAASPQQFNAAAGNLMYTEYAFPEFRAVVDEVIAETREIYGTQGVPENVKPNQILNSGMLMSAIPNAPDDPTIVRITPDSLREKMRPLACGSAARILLAGMASEDLKALENPVILLEKDYPQLVADLKNAKTAQEATAALNALNEPMARLASIASDCKAATAGIKDRMLQKLAKAAKMDLADVRRNFDTGDFNKMVSDLATKIVKGEVDIGGAEAIKTAFDKFVDDFVKRHSDITDKIDGMDLPDLAKFQMKSLVMFGWKTVKYIDMDVIKNAVSEIDLDELEAELNKPDATDEDVFHAFVKVNNDMDAKMKVGFDKFGRLDPDDKRLAENILVVALAHSREGLFEKLANFFDRPSVKDDDAGFFIKGGKGKAAAKFVYVFVNPTFDDFMKKNPNEIQ